MTNITALQGIVLAWEGNGSMAFLHAALQLQHPFTRHNAKMLP